MNDLNMLLDLRRNANPGKSLIHLDEFVESILKNFSEVIQSKQALVYSACPNSALVYTQPSLLNSILFNLLSNALKYTSPKRQPEIKIDCELTNDFVSIAISDNGLGLDLKRYGDQLFTPFRRFHTHTDGKGLGLNMVKTQVEMLGGTIHVESKVDVGSKFTVTIPLEAKSVDRA